MFWEDVYRVLIIFATHIAFCGHELLSLPHYMFLLWSRVTKCAQG